MQKTIIVKAPTQTQIRELSQSDSRSNITVSPITVRVGVVRTIKTTVTTKIPITIRLEKTGSPGTGIPMGGIAGHPLIKKGTVNYETEWWAYSLLPISVLDNTLTDGSIYNLPQKSGFGWVMIGEMQEWMQFLFSGNGSYEILNSSANVSGSDSPGSMCLLASGSQVYIKNNLGSSLKLQGMVIAA